MEWKERLYAVYVSSGQATRKQHSASETLFASRKPYLTKLIRQHIPQQWDLRVVDLGCGHGAWLYCLKQAGYVNVEGVDVSAEQVTFAHKLGIIDVIQSDIMSYLSTQQAESVDVFLLMDVLEHLSRQELFDMLDSVYRAMRANGRVLIHVPNGEGLYGMRVRYGDLTHEGAFTPRSIRQTLTAVGFVNVKCFEDRPIPHSLFSTIRRIIWDVGTLYPRLLLMAETGHWATVLSQNMVVVAEKTAPHEL